MRSDTRADRHRRFYQRQRGYRARRLEDGFPEWKIAGLPVGSIDG
jgi:hypothetical protein